jgi:RNA polymerase sigma-70 factor, ECF subfamily
MTRPTADSVEPVATEPIPASVVPADPLDADSRRWVDALSGIGHDRE